MTHTTLMIMSPFLFTLKFHSIKEVVKNNHRHGFLPLSIFSSWIYNERILSVATPGFLRYKKCYGLQYNVLLSILFISLWVYKYRYHTFLKNIYLITDGTHLLPCWCVVIEATAFVILDSFLLSLLSRLLFTHISFELINSM